MKDAVIVSAVRTAVGKAPKGTLRNTRPDDLGAAAIKEAVARAGVPIEACHNALDEKKITPASLPAFVKVVPAGVIALAQAQAEGYAYVKP